MIWDILNSLLRVAIMGIAIWKLWRFFPQYNLGERLGLSMLAGCSFLTVSVIWEGQRSPFDGWAATIFSAGVLLFFLGRMMRLLKHERANQRQIEDASRYFWGAKR